MTFATTLADVVTWVGAIILVVAGIAKLRRPRAAAEFAASVRLPRPRATVLAAGAAEICVGVTLFATAAAIAAVAALMLYGGFIAVLSLHWWRTGQRTVSCGCFGASQSVPVIPHLVALVALAISTAATGSAAHPSFIGAFRSLSGLDAALFLSLVSITVAVLIAAALEQPDPAASKQVVPRADTTAPAFRVVAPPLPIEE